MKIYFKLFIFAWIFLLSVPAYAANLNDSFGSSNDFAPLERTAIGANYDIATDEYSVDTIVMTAINTTVSILGTIFVLLMVYGGIIWMTAEGSEDQVKRGKKIIAEATIGLFIVIAAYAISYFITSIFFARELSPTNNQ